MTSNASRTGPCLLHGIIRFGWTSGDLPTPGGQCSPEAAGLCCLVDVAAWTVGRVLHPSHQVQLLLLGLRNEEG